MKYLILVFCSLLLNCATSSENTDYYSFIGNKNINLKYSLDHSRFIDNDFVTHELTYEQRNELLKFMEIFESDYEYIAHILQGTAFKYDIFEIVLFNDFRGGYLYGLCTNFYSTERLAHHSKYYDEEKHWETYNIALFYIENNQIVFGGWHI